MKKLIVTTVIGIYLCLSDVSASELTIVDKSITKTIKNWGQLKPKHIGEFSHLKSVLKTCDDIKIDIEKELVVFKELEDIEKILKDFRSKQKGFWNTFASNDDNLDSYIAFIIENMNTYQKATNSLPSYSSALTNLQANLKSVILELDTNILKYQKDISSKAKKINGNTSHIESILDKLQRMKSESNKAIKDAESYKLEIKNKLLKEFNRVVFDLDNMKTSLSLTRDFNSLSIEIKKIDLNRIVQLNSSISENLDFVTKQIDDIYLNKRGM